MLLSRMHGITLYSLTLMCVFSASQKYKEINIGTEMSSRFYKMVPYRREFMYEVKTCMRVVVILYKKGTKTFTYRTVKIQESNSTLIKMAKYPNPYTYLIQESTPSLMCTEFRKFKFSWSNDNLTLWTAMPTGWKMLLKWHDPSLYTDGFEYVHLWGDPVEWKVYQIEHTEKPFRVTCIKF